MQPSRAPVKPRFVSKTTGDALTLEESVLDAFRHFHSGIVEISGPSGAGKSFALRHLAAVLPLDLGIEFPGEIEPHQKLPTCGIVVEVQEGAEPLPGRIARFDLAPWGSDELIEYSLACHPDHCKSVIGRLLASPDRDLLAGCPELCSLVLDRMAGDATLSSVAAALKDAITELTRTDNTNLPSPAQLLIADEHLTISQQQKSVPARLQRLLRHESVRDVALAKLVSDDLNADRTTAVHALRHCRSDDRRTELIRLIFPHITPDGMNCIRRALKRSEESRIHGMLASILFLLDSAWRPDVDARPDLAGALFSLASWPQIDLRHFILMGTDFRGACLNRALFIEANLTGADLSTAVMQRARMRKVRAKAADFCNADLRELSAQHGQFEEADFSRAKVTYAAFDDAVLLEADLTDASFRHTTFRRAYLSKAILTGTDLSWADLTGAQIVHTNLTDAILDGTVFDDADLGHSRLEFIRMSRARFSGARLSGALLTGASMKNADFRRCRIVGAYLAAVDWSGSDLRGANLVGSTFHMGSSRSGLVNSDIASEGTRTGFYSNDYDDHHYRRPEEIRTANLCNCDLRGAILEGVDFYRVDLRGAKFDHHHLEQFVATGAILE